MFPFLDQAGTPGSAHAAPVEPATLISREKEKPPTSWGDRQLCQSRKVVRAKVVKVVG